MSVDDFFQGNSFTLTKTFKFVRWQPSTPGRVKLNFDGSLQGNSVIGGYILHDLKGAILLVEAANYGHTLVIMTEGRALKDGVHAAIEAGYTMMDIEGDNFITIGAL